MDIAMNLAMVVLALLAIYGLFYWLFIVPMAKHRVVEDERDSATADLDPPIPPVLHRNWLQETGL